LYNTIFFLRRPFERYLDGNTDGRDHAARFNRFWCIAGLFTSLQFPNLALVAEVQVSFDSRFVVVLFVVPDYRERRTLFQFDNANKLAFLSVQQYLCDDFPAEAGSMVCSGWAI
jgi:hypothetical protein